MRYFAILLLFLVISASLSGQSYLSMGLKEIYTSLSKFNDSIYIGESICTDPIEYSDLKDYVEPKDTPLLKEIIEQGNREIINSSVIQQLLLPYQVRVLSPKEFWNVVVPEPVMNKDELLIYSQLDSLERYINFNELDSAKFATAFKF